MTEHAPLSFWHPAKMLSTWFGVGLIPKAPGTWGSLAALPLAYVVHVNAGNVALMCVAMLIFLLGWHSSSVYVRKTGRKDPKEVVIDEVAGQCLLLSVMFPTWSSYLIGFILFRLFDVTKPWPISWVDRHIGGGLGVMLDDMLAAMAPVVILAIVGLVCQFGNLPFAPENIMAVLAYPQKF